MEVKILLAISVFEIVLLVAVLGIYLHIVSNQLHNISSYLAKVTFGVRAIESQCAVIGPAVTRVNQGLGQVASNLTGAIAQAERAGR